MDSLSQPKRIGQTHMQTATHMDQMDSGSERFLGENHGPIDDAPTTPMMPNDAPSITRLTTKTVRLVPAMAPMMEPIMPQPTAMATDPFMPSLLTKPVVGNAMMKPMM